MVTINHTEQGFIFVNEMGQYAVSGVSFDHGPTRQIIRWVDGINQAEIFPHEAMMRRRFKELKKCQSLKAIAKREVLIREWEA